MLMPWESSRSYLNSSSSQLDNKDVVLEFSEKCFMSLGMQYS